MTRLADLTRFYGVINELQERSGGSRSLAELQDWRDLPPRGVYFFFEPGEERRETGNGPRVVRVGTHALTDGAKSTLRQRLTQHRGARNGGGNHRGSIFRLLVGQALLARGDVPPCETWGAKADMAKTADALGIDRSTVAATEAPIEIAVSASLAAMNFVWISINDEPSREGLRGVIERNSIALLSNCHRDQLDAASSNWLGRFSNRPLVRDCGLWNQRHVEEDYDPGFLDQFERAVGVTRVSEFANPTG
jgi:hypothetical protein